MKRIGKALAGVLAAVFLGQAVLAAPLLGDVDGDGAVTAKDKMTLARYADGWEGYSIDEDAGDIDRDGDVDAEDAEQLGRYFAGYEDDWGIGEAAERFPVDISIDWTNAVKKEYVDGYVIGSDPADWEGIVVAVTYQDGDIEKYKTISTISSLGLVLTPLNISNRYVTVQTVEGRKMEIATYLPADFNILKREVVSISLDYDSLVNARTTYTEGEKLDLSGVKILLHCNNGVTLSRSVTNDEFITSPKHGAQLTIDTTEVLIVYCDPDTGVEYSTTLPISVAKAASTIKEVVLIAEGIKTEYYIGESFEKEGYRLLVTYTDATSSKYVELKNCLNFAITDTTKYNNGKFIKAFSGSLNITFKLPSSVDKDQRVYSLTLSNIFVTKRPVLQSIVADCIKGTYMVGDMPEVQQFTITAKYDDNSTRVFQFADDVTDTEKAKSTFTDTIGGVTYTIKVTPTRIEEGTDAIRVSYSEKVSGSGSTITKYDDVEIEVVVPDAILSYYDSGWKTKAYMDFDKALDAAEEYADQLTSSYQKSRKPSIQLCKDITVLYDYSVTEYMEIDLNGFDLIMVPGEIFVKSTSSAELTFTNTASEDGRIIYSNDESDVVVIANGEQCVLDADTVLPPKVYPTSSILNLFVNGDGTITYTPKTSGRLYYYYLKLNVVPAAADFPNLWNVAVNSDVIDVTEGVAGTIIYDTVYAETHPYMVFSIEDESGTYRSPVSILLQEGEQVGPVEDEEVTVASTGFTVEPYCDLTEQAVYFKAAQSGTIYYYFSRTSNPYNESSEDFWTSYANATSGHYGSYLVSTSLDYIPFANVDTKYYPGIMLMLVDEHDNEFYPVYVSLTKDDNSIDSTTGITVLSVTSSEVKFSVDTTGVVKYYFMGYGINTTTHYDSGTTYAYKNGIVTIEHTGRYYSLVIEVEGYEPCVIDLTQDYDRDEDINDGSNKSGYGFSNYDIEFVGGQIVITGIANVSGTITGSISNVNGSESSVTVTKGDAFTLVIDHDIDSFMNSSTGQLVGAGTLYVQLTAENGDVYERLEVTLG